jgi:16S rRNA (cytosine967-C5)-methyltransferase
LVAVDDGAHIDDALADSAPARRDDRALAWFLALGTLRQRAIIDAALRDRLRQPIATLDPEVRAILRLGTFEKLFARTQAHAVVHQAVEVARALDAGRATGLVNAVLRRVAMPANVSRSDRLNHPSWLVARWTDRYGAEAAERWCLKNAENPPLTVVSQKPMGEPTRCAGVVVPDVWTVTHTGRLEELEGYDDGTFWVADPASVAVADLVPQGTVLDACAAPGGKTFRLISRGCRVRAIDVNNYRLGTLEEGARRLRMDVTLGKHDWTRGPMPDGLLYDSVLVDAPCTGLGTVRRHPDIRWRRQLPDLLAAAERQAAILEAASAHVAPAGALVYAVCSPEPEEGTDIVRSFLANHPEFVLDTELATAPPVDDEDGFYAARMYRTQP